MYRDRKVIVIVPTGRKETLELLVPHLLAAREWIDKCHLWVNTMKRSDLVYIASLEKSQPDFFKRIFSRVPVSGNFSVSCFYRREEYCSPSTVCIKLDDDIVWMGTDTIRNLLDFRLRNAEYFLVVANIWNNQLCDHVNQRSGLLPDEPHIEWNCGGSSWRNGASAERIHRHLLAKLESGASAGDLARFERWHLRHQERISINFVCWLGEDLGTLLADGGDGPIGGGDDEHYLSHEAPRKLGKLNVICGNAPAAHYSFFPQKAHMGQTDILQLWQKHIPRKISIEGVGSK